MYCSNWSTCLQSHKKSFCSKYTARNHISKKSNMLPISMGQKEISQIYTMIYTCIHVPPFLSLSGCMPVYLSYADTSKHVHKNVCTLHTYAAMYVQAHTHTHKTCTHTHTHTHTHTQTDPPPSKKKKKEKRRLKQ